jgi:glycosyltransferase involved in cell wall biosynthesis
MLSVIIPLYNKEKSISNTIESVLNQSYRDFELLIVNDGSTDRSINAVEKFKDDRIRIINKSNGGVSSARNRGIREAKSEWIAFLDGDDYWEPSFLSTLNELKSRYPDAGMYAGQYAQVDNDKNIIVLNRFPPIIEGYFDLFSYLFAVNSSSILVNKNVFDICGYFDENLTHGEDTDMWIRIGLKFQVCYTNTLISYYNIGGNPLSRSVGKFPPFNKRFLSKIDNYFLESNYEWNNFLLNLKAKGLKQYIKRYPFKREFQERVNKLPYDIRKQNGLLNIEKQRPILLIKLLLFEFPKNILRKIVYSLSK